MQEYRRHILSATTNLWHLCQGNWMGWSYWKKKTRCTSWNMCCTGWRTICSLLNMDSREVRVRQLSMWRSKMEYFHVKRSMLLIWWRNLTCLIVRRHSQQSIMICGTRTCAISILLVGHAANGHEVWMI